MTVTWQLLNVSFAVGYVMLYVMLVAAAMIHLRRQSLSEQDLLLWDLIMIFIPFAGAGFFIRCLTMIKCHQCGYNLSRTDDY